MSAVRETMSVPSTSPTHTTTGEFQVTTADRDDVVDQVWPYDGPHSQESVTSAASAAARLVRYMNNATFDPTRLNGPSLYRTVSALHSSQALADQLLRQLAGTAAELAGDDTLYDDRRDRPAAATADEVNKSLTQARDALKQVEAHLHQAAEAASHLGHNY